MSDPLFSYYANYPNVDSNRMSGEVHYRVSASFLRKNAFVG